MKQTGIELFEYLTSLPEFTAVMGTRLFPLVSDSDTPFPFAIYGVRAFPGSKDSDSYEITLSAYFGPNAYDECAGFCDMLRPLLEDKYGWTDSSVDVAEEDYSFIGTINLKTQ
ncbi:hypothetical protein ASG38_14995 [Flavobacterium sp. Leaf359]|uniref:hypothetical protein n=1 Tax=Flavobacterium sp. Leaf359 TaxID=1736351 RepID=UPI0006FF0E3E|nr:hypothetical protein [Flavobacterium sp. Leaf359]KQS45914.1 hypothetical protein ASG38_14995 [Flavobacterium sp. Leaf359]